MVELVGFEISLELVVEHDEHVAIELGGDAGTVVIGGDQTSRILDQVGANKEMVTDGHVDVEVEEESTPLARSQVAYRAAQEGHKSSSVPGNVAEMAMEIADDCGHLDAVGSSGIFGGGSECLFAHIERNESSKFPLAGHGVKEQPRLLRRARSELDERVSSRRRRDLLGVSGKDRALGRRQVVLR